jgi:hypothetical protein
MPAESRNTAEPATTLSRGARMERVLAQKATVGAVTALEGHVIEIAFEDQTLQIAAAR